MFSADFKFSGTAGVSQQMADDALKAIDSLCQLIASRQPLIVQKHTFDRRASDFEAEEIVRFLFHVTTVEKRATQRAIDHCGKLLLVLAFALDLEREHPQDARKKKRKQLLNYMPDQAMDRLLGVLKEHPLYAIIKAWNDRTQSFRIIEQN